jgi:hypothetical protein
MLSHTEVIFRGLCPDCVALDPESD